MPCLQPNRLALAVAAALSASAALADPGYYVVTAYPDAGRTAVEFRYWNVAAKGWPETIWPEFGVTYGINSRWTTGLLASWIGASGQATRVSSWNWSNDVLLTQGEWPVDVALHAQWIRAAEHGGTQSVEIGPALQTDVGRTQLNANLLFERRSGAPTLLKYQWQVRHRTQPGLHLGAQGFGELGPWADWSAAAGQSHRAGPALFSHLVLDEQRTLDLQAAYLFGRVYDLRADMLSVRVQFGF
jgi:hypothetical protein